MQRFHVSIILYFCLILLYSQFSKELQSYGHICCKWSNFSTKYFIKRHLWDLSIHKRWQPERWKKLTWSMKNNHNKESSLRTTFGYRICDGTFEPLHVQRYTSIVNKPKQHPYRRSLEYDRYSWRRIQVSS